MGYPVQPKTFILKGDFNDCFCMEKGHMAGDKWN
jgi:hypothetical protein